MEQHDLGLVGVSVELSGALAFLAGLAGWIGLAVVMAGAALLTWVFTEDTPGEWLSNGPISRNNSRFSGRFETWQRNPATACQALIKAIYAPAVTLTLLRPIWLNRGRWC